MASRALVSGLSLITLVFAQSCEQAALVAPLGAMAIDPRCGSVVIGGGMKHSAGRIRKAMKWCDWCRFTMRRGQQSQLVCFLAPVAVSKVRSMSRCS